METLKSENQIMFMTSIRNKIHNILSNEEIYNKFLEILTNNICAINIYITPENKYIITLKIRKSYYKKDSNFVHNSIYYNNIFNNIYSQFLNYLKSIGLDESLSNNENINNIINNYNISLLYNITCISDNIIVLHV